MRNTFMLAALAASLSLPASAAVTLKADEPVCLTEEYLDQLGKSIIERDVDAGLYLLNHACVVSAKPLHVTVLDVSSWGTKVRIRVYRGNRAAEVWAYRDALDGYGPPKP